METHLGAVNWTKARDFQTFNLLLSLAKPPMSDRCSR